MKVTLIWPEVISQKGMVRKIIITITDSLSSSVPGIGLPKKYRPILSKDTIKRTMHSNPETNQAQPLDNHLIIFKKKFISLKVEILMLKQ
jgi:hypothetical protein